jgi:alpha-tubulin suppressor-like RCC1 family protein
MHTPLTRPAALLAALLLATACSDDAAKADPFALDDPRADMSAPDLATSPDMDTPDIDAPAPDMDAPDMDAPDLMPLDMAPAPELTFTAIAVGAGHICAITDAGALYCWGRNTSGQVGVGSEADSVPTPTLVPGMEFGVIAVSAAGQSTCAVKGDSLYCWGDNTAPLVDDKPALLRTPTLNLILERGVTAVSTSGAHTCVVRAGKVYCWGKNEAGQLGYEILSELPRIIDNMTGEATSVSAGAHHACAIDSEGLWCWGDNTDRRLGVDTEEVQIRPTRLVTGTDMTQLNVAVSDQHSCMSRWKNLSCWGIDSSGQLGSTEPEPKNTPYNRPTLTNVTSFALAPQRTCAIVSGGVSCWGDLTHGLPDEPGQPPLRAVTSPQIMPGLERGVSAIATGPSNTCVLMAGLIRCLGDAQYGQLPQASLTPVFIEVR